MYIYIYIYMFIYLYICVSRLNLQRAPQALLRGRTMGDGKGKY